MSALHDVRQAARFAVKNPGFAIVAVLTLALGIGASTAIFSVVNNVLIRPLPYRDAGRLVIVYEGLPKFAMPEMPFSAPDFEAFRRATKTLDGLSAFQNKELELSGIEQPRHVTGARATAGLFALLGVEPPLGRVFTEQEDREGRMVAVLSHGLWQSAFGGDPAVLGRNVILDRRPYAVVGVLPAGFEFPPQGPAFNNEPADVFVPASFTPAELESRGSMYNHSAIARLGPGVSLEQVRDEARRIVPELEKPYPAELRGDGRFSLTVSVRPFREAVVGDVRTLVLVLMGAVGMVLLIACANVANMLLAKGASRQREIAMRIALGASRLALVRQLLVESVVLSLAGGAVGVLLAWWGARLLVASSPVTIPRSGSIGIDATVLAFTMLVSALTALVFGLVPAFHAIRAGHAETLKAAAGRATITRGRRRLLGALVTAQFALALVLSIGAGLLVRSFANLAAADPGFRPDHTLTLSVTLPFEAYGRAPEIRGFANRLAERMQGLPGVSVSGTSTALPMNPTEFRMFTPERPAGEGRGAAPSVVASWVKGQVFEALRVPLRKGRLFTAQEMERPADRVVIVNETLARRFYPGRDPIGQRIKWGAPTSETPWMTIVGVVSDVQQGPPGSETLPEIYEPHAQLPDEALEFRPATLFREFYVALRTGGSPLSLAAEARRAIRELDPSLPVANVQSMETVVANWAKPQRFSAALVGGFAGAALLLAAIGLWGVLAYSVAVRTSEIGIRMALGAARGDVTRMVVRQGIVYAAGGIIVGLAGAFALTRVLARLLFGLSPTDPLTFAGVPLVLAAVAVGAAYLPARRATGIDPVTALRAE